MRNSIILLLLACFWYTTSTATNTREKENTLFQTTADERPKFRIGFNAPLIDHRQLLLTLDTRCTDGIDHGFEGEMFQMIEDDMYWRLEDRNFVIQAVGDISIDKEFPIGITMAQEGEVQIMIDAFENPIDSLDIYLKDKELNKLYKIQDSTFQTTLAAGEYNSRFVITFKGKGFVNQPEPTQTQEEVVVDEIPIEILDPALVVESIEKCKKVRAFYNHKTKEVVINNKCELTLSKARIYNRKGSKVQGWSINKSDKRIKLPVKKIRKGIYYLKIKSEIKLHKKKVLVK